MFKLNLRIIKNNIKKMKIKVYFLISISLLTFLFDTIITENVDESKKNSIITGCHNLVMSRVTYDLVKIF